MSEKIIKAAMKPVVIGFDDFDRYGCTCCGSQEGRSLIEVNDIVLIWRCLGSGCDYTFIVLPEGVSGSPIGIREKNQNIFYPILVGHPLAPADKRLSNGGQFFSSCIGTKLQTVPGCFICGGRLGLYNYITGFVSSKQAGEQIVEMFDGKGAWLINRYNQVVVVGACDDHKSNLGYLNSLIHKKPEGVIIKELIQQAMIMPLK